MNADHGIYEMFPAENWFAMFIMDGSTKSQIYSSEKSSWNSKHFKIRSHCSSCSSRSKEDNTDILTSGFLLPGEGGSFKNCTVHTKKYLQDEQMCKEESVSDVRNSQCLGNYFQNPSVRIPKQVGAKLYYKKS